MKLVLPQELAGMVRLGVKVTHRLKTQRGRRRPEVGDSALVQLPSRKAICHVEVLAVSREFLHEITDVGALKEGHADRGEFFAWWRETQEGVEPPASRDVPRRQIPVWVVRFQLDERRFLAAHPGVTSASSDSLEARGYVTSPKSGLPAEAVDEITQKRISNGELASNAQRRYDMEREQAQAARLARPVEEQLRDELEALRQEFPQDVPRYELQALNLARRINAKRRKRAA